MQSRTCRPQDERRVAVAPSRQQAAVPRPVGGGAAGHVARPDHGIRAGVDQGEHLGEHRRVVGEVDVHRDDDVVALVEGDGEAVAVGAAEALLARTPQQLDLAELGRRLLDERGRAVGAVVVDDEHVGVGQRPAHGGEQHRHVLALVVRRQHDDDAVRATPAQATDRLVGAAVAHPDHAPEDAEHAERRLVPRERPCPGQRGSGEALPAAGIADQRGDRRAERRRAPRARPVRPSTTEQRWPRMSVATAGVPHAAPSVSERPQPSASEALATSHAWRYSSRSWPCGTAPRRRAQLRRAVLGDPALQIRRAAGPSPTMRTLQVGHLDAGPLDRLEQQLEALDRSQAADGDDGRVRRAVAAGREVRVDAVVDGGDEVGPEPELDQLLTRRLRRRDGVRPPVEGRGEREPRGSGRRRRTVAA